MNAREAAFLAIIDFESTKVDETLLQYKKNLSEKDYKLAREIASGTVKRLLTLQYFAKKMQRKLGLKKPEKRLLYSAIYQYVFLDRLPLYAIVNETIDIAKKHFGARKAKFFNALLRKLEGADFSVSAKKNAFDLSIRTSFPPFFIKSMISEYGMQKTLTTLDVLNDFFPLMFRMRKKISVKGAKRVRGNVYTKTTLENLTETPDVYIQNVTPILLMEELAKRLPKKPKRILDLCAAPGGKLLLAHDLFPDADLYANDVSDEKMRLLKSNLKKYAINAKTTICRAEKWESDERFDLILLDVPCSNTGVLHKRCEARWRITPDALDDLSDLQANILENAVKYLAPGGEIWYMTCSILKDENEDTIPFAESLGLKKREEHKVLPNEKGWDGGYGISFFL